MYRAPLHSLSRILLAGCAVGLCATGLYAQSSTSTPTAPTPKTAPVSRIDIFAGYSYYAPHDTVTTTDGAGNAYPVRYGSVDEGAIGSVAYFFNRYVGGVVEYADHTLGKNDGFRNLATGLIFRYPTSMGVTPFVHAMAGASEVGGPNAEPFVSHSYNWGPLVKVGGGLDYDTPFFNHHLGIRLFQADYVYSHADFGPQPITGGRANIGAAELSSGLLFKFGNIVPPPPVTYTCSANPMSVFPGDPVTVTGTAANLNPKKPATYTWSGQGVTVKGDSSTGTVDTASLQPGDYTVTGHVSEGAKPGMMADCSSHFTVKQFEPPTVSCSANPTSLNPGDSSTITAMGVSPQNRPLTYSYSATSGQISGTTNTATLSTAGAPAGDITVTCNVADDKGQTASSTTTVTVAAPPAPAPKTQTLCDVTFDRDHRRPARVDNEAKACLDDVALNAQRSADASLVVVGNAAPMPEMHGRHRRHHEMMSPEKLAAQRAVNTKAYLVEEKGIDASRISVRTSTKGTNEVDNYLVPAGANFDTDMPGTTAVDTDTVKAQARTAHHGGRRHHHHHAARK
jgi:outer membrane protein OmpA-like peptidoglycan-associated protein